GEAVEHEPRHRQRPLMQERQRTAVAVRAHDVAHSRIPVVVELVDEPEAQPYRVGEVDAGHAPRIRRVVEDAVGGKGEGVIGKGLPGPAADLVARAPPRRRVYRVELRGHELKRRARQAGFERITSLRSSPRKRGPRGRGSGLGVPGLASLARDTKSWIPAV